MHLQLKIRQRLGVSLLVAVTKMFPCGFFWQLLGFAVPGGADSLLQFAFATGAGDAFGVFAGNTIQSVVLRLNEQPEKREGSAFGTHQFGKSFFRAVLLDSTVLAIGAFCSGSVWQPMVHVVSSSDLSFTIGALLVGVSPPNQMVSIV